jgi:lipoprotein-anchoring transpeptidase ErfK/SrfK
LCSNKLKPSPEPPEAQKQPPLKADGIVPLAYYAVIDDGTPAYAKVEDVPTSTVAKELSKKFMLVGGRSVDIDGVSYLSTDRGLVEQAALRRFYPSPFSGIDLREQPPSSWPFAWVVVARGGKSTVYAEPSKEAPAVRKAARRDVVPVLEEQGDYVRIGAAEWIERAHLRIARPALPPADVRGGEQWIDVDLDEQVLIAFEGATPVFATLVATGRKGHDTPPAIYRVRAKAATTAMMGGDESSPHRYEISGVPWAIRFRKGLFIHTAYWHDSFGNITSHGCINVSPRDARFLFDWVEPQVPDGWSEIEVLDGNGPIVRVRDRASPSPPPHDYSDEEPAGKMR